MSGVLLGRTRSVCPVCLAALPADIIRKGADVLLRRVCPEHGEYNGLIWRGEPDFALWKRPKKAASLPLRERETRRGCPHDCGRCPDHAQQACTVLFEITGRCNLRCPVCFADAGTAKHDRAGFTPPDTLVDQLRWIREHAGAVVLQLSGGEPTLHPALPDLTREAKKLFPAVQLNTNGLLLAERPHLAKELAEAGLSWVFLQFDGTDDAIHSALRGAPLLRKKLRAISNCADAGLSVVLVPTLARGVNDTNLGQLLDLALSLAPTVRGLHLQPMTASGRNCLPGNAEPLTLPETLQALCAQSKGRINVDHASPPGCEHERCSFHCRYRLAPSGALVPLRGESALCCPAPGLSGGKAPGSSPQPASVPVAPGRGDGRQRAIDVIMRAWQAPGQTGAPGRGEMAGQDAFDAFIRAAASHCFSISCMAFQEAMTLDLERLKGCCVHVFKAPGRLVPFCACNLTSLDGRPLHR